MARLAVSTAASAGEHLSMFVYVKAATGGKLHVFLTSLPKVGAHALPVRDGGMGAEGKDTKNNAASHERLPCFSHTCC